MKNKGIVIFLIVLAVVIVAIIAGDYLSDKPDKLGPNPYAYSVDDFRNVDSTLIKYRETKNFRVNLDTSASFTVDSDKIYLATDKKIQVIDVAGNLVNEFNIGFKPQAVEVFNRTIYVAETNRISVFETSGKLQKQWELLGRNALITALATNGKNVFVADAGRRKVVRFDISGKKLSEFDGKANEGDIHGFIIPSPNFDLDINPDGDLWVVNPGMHALENYTEDGNLREHWNNTSMMTEGFSGCCNPVHFKFLPDGRFVTSEKGLVRIKVYKTSGEFDCVVAPPAKFKAEGHAPDVAVDSNGNIYALDFDKQMIRVFEKK